MRIGGLSKQTLIDYPGKIAATVFTQGCNFRCGYCHNPSLVIPELFKQTPTFSTTDFLLWLKKRVGWLDAVVITGGEPTIHKALPEFIKSIKDLGFAVKLDTNGTNPVMLQALLDAKLVDFVAMDIKHRPDKKCYQQVIGIKTNEALMDRIHHSVVLLQQAMIECQFRTTSIPGIHQSFHLEEIEKWLERPLTIQHFRKAEKVGDYRHIFTVPEDWEKQMFNVF